jgi:hypothetical protein
MAAALFATSVNAGSGMNSTSRAAPAPAPAQTTSRAQTRVQAPAPAQAQKPVAAPAVSQTAPAPKSGFSGGSGVSREASVQAPSQKSVPVAPQGATAQALSREAGKVSAVLAFDQAARQSAEKSRIEREKKASERQTETARATARAPSTNNTATTGASNPPRERVVIIERTPSNDSYWQGVAAGQSMNRPPVVVSQPGTYSGSSEYSAPYSPAGSPQATHYKELKDDGSSLWSIAFVLLFLALIGGTIYVLFRRRASVQAAQAHVPNYRL